MQCLPRRLRKERQIISLIPLRSIVSRILSAGLYLGATDVSNLHLKICECKCFWMFDFWNTLSCAEGRGALTTFATALPQIINGGLGLERPHHCPAEKYTHQTSYFWSEGLHVVEFLFLPHPWISTGWYCIAWPYSRCKLYEGYHLHIDESQ